MKRLFWFGLGVFAGVRLTRRGNAMLEAFMSDPVRALDRLVRVGAPLVQKAIRSARSTIEV